MCEFTALLDQDISDGVRHRNTGDWQIAGGQPFGHNDHVGAESEVICREPLAGSSESAYHLIGDQQNSVLFANPCNFGPIGIRRYNDSACSLYGFGDECGDMVHTEFENLLFQCSCSH